MPNIYFTADHHFGHGNIISLCKRPFANIKQMNDRLIQNWNEKVRPQDTVYHLGDFAYKNEDRPSEIFSQLNGTIHLIAGNHDYRHLGCYGALFKSVNQILVLKLSPKMVLCHYSMRSWLGSVKDSWHLYAHSHGKMPSYGLSFDIGVDVWNFYPVSYDEVREKMKIIKEKRYAS
jgi:calcineurin-like phosphoesterase family protein